VRASGFASIARDFVELLRARAARSHAEADRAKFAGLKDVDGRISYRVPVGSVLRPALIAFARAVQPDLFPASDDDYDFDVSFIYLPRAHSGLSDPGLPRQL
jgi:hypothetical protein